MLGGAAHSTEHAHRVVGRQVMQKQRTHHHVEAAGQVGRQHIELKQLDRGPSLCRASPREFQGPLANVTCGDFDRDAVAARFAPK